jgi:hypothetical protein
LIYLSGAKVEDLKLTKAEGFRSSLGAGAPRFVASSGSGKAQASSHRLEDVEINLSQPPKA